MTTKVVPGQLVAAVETAQVADEAASRIARALRTALRRGGRVSIALSGGNTPRAAYAKLAKEPQIDWSLVDVFWADERAVPPADDRSNYRWARETLLEAAHVPERCVHRMPADDPDLEGAARAYEALVRAKVLADADGIPAFDVMVCGVGDDGHTASLFPGDPGVTVADRLVIAVPAKPGREARLSLTAPVLDHAKAMFVLAVGATKCDALERVWSMEGDVTETPARVLRSVRGALTWVIDRAAGGILD